MRVFSEQARTNPIQKVLEVALLLLVLAVLGVVFMVATFSGGPTEKEASKRIACMSNMKQLMSSIEIYAADNDQAIPAHYTFESAAEAALFRSSVEPYLKQPNTAFLCLSDPAVWGKTLEPGQGPQPIAGAMSHTHCQSLKSVIPGFASGKRSLKLSATGDPAKVPFMRDPIWIDSRVAKSFHGEGIVMGFLDLHVKYKKPVDIKTDL